MKKLILFFFLFFLLCSSVKADSFVFYEYDPIIVILGGGYDIFGIPLQGIQNEANELVVYCANDDGLGICDRNISCFVSLNDPQGYNLFASKNMSRHYPHFNLTIAKDNFTKDGFYTGVVFCGLNETEASGFAGFSFEVTFNGKRSPCSFVIISFSSFFLLILFVMTGLLLSMFGKFAEFEFTLTDLIYNMSSYFVLFGFYILSKMYLGNAFIDDFTLWLIRIGAVTTVFLPFVAFIVSYIMQTIKKGDHN